MQPVPRIPDGEEGPAPQYSRAAKEKEALCMFEFRKNPYGDIIHLPHHVSAVRPQMPMRKRAAQFAPFAALRGYDEALREARRQTEERIQLDETALELLNRKLRLLADRLDDAPEVTFTWFRPDPRKSGGAYLQVTGTVSKVDPFHRRIVLQDGTILPMDDVFDIQGEILESLESPE